VWGDMKKISHVKRWLILAIVLVVGTVLSISASRLAELGMKRLQINELSASVSRWTTIWEFSTDKEITSFKSLAALFGDVSVVSSPAFLEFTKRTLTYYPDLKQIFWVPELPAEQRGIVDATLRRGKPVSFIKDFAGPAGFFPSAARNTYYPMLFLDGDKSINSYRGWELGGFSAFSNLFGSPQLSKNGDVVMRFLPALEDIAAKKQRPRFQMLLLTRADKKTVLSENMPAISEKGFFGVFVDFSKIFGYFGDIPNIDKVQVHITAINDDGKVIDIFKVKSTSGKLLPKYELRSEFNAQAAQNWTISIIPTDAYFNSRATVTHQWLLFGGLIITLLLLAYIYSVQRQALMIEKIVVERTNELQQANLELDRLSNTDYLTGLFNRRYFEEALDREWKRSLREHTSLTMVMMDIDYFKQYNDHYGHIEGDYCLQQVAKMLLESVNRPADVVARFGGEEFVILLPNTDEKASLVAERCRAAVEELCLPHAKSAVSQFVTVSIGVATVRPAANLSIRTLTKCADQALYKAKADGRNRVFVNENTCEPIHA
jgi:diguanylate cyclase (GGDEF)-like protein